MDASETPGETSKASAASSTVMMMMIAEMVVAKGPAAGHPLSGVEKISTFKTT